MKCPHDNGCNRLDGRALDHDLSQEWAVIEMREIYNAVRCGLPHIAIDFSNVPNRHCEVDKWLRMRNGEGKMKRRYTPTDAPDATAD
jgi:hypothetical protein